MIEKLLNKSLRTIQLARCIFGDFNGVDPSDVYSKHIRINLLKVYFNKDEYFKNEVPASEDVPQNDLRRFEIDRQENNNDRIVHSQYMFENVSRLSESLPLGSVIEPESPLAFESQILHPKPIVNLPFILPDFKESESFEYPPQRDNVIPIERELNNNQQLKSKNGIEEVSGDKIQEQFIHQISPSNHENENSKFKIHHQAIKGVKEKDSPQDIITSHKQEDDRPIRKPIEDMKQLLKLQEEIQNDQIKKQESEHARKKILDLTMTTMSEYKVMKVQLLRIKEDLKLIEKQKELEDTLASSKKKVYLRLTKGRNNKSPQSRRESRRFCGTERLCEEEVHIDFRRDGEV